MSKTPHILIIGCGSIGARHARNFSKFSSVSVCDADEGKTAPLQAELSCTAYIDMGTALAAKPDGVVVALPTHLHFAAAEKALESGAFVLVEKPVCSTLEDAKKLVALGGERLFVVSNMRFHQAIDALREGMKKIGQPLFARAQFGNYLPSMRPNADYTQLYVAKRETGGGAVMDCIHEIDYLQHLFGTVTEVKASLAKISDLKIEAEDYAALLLTHASGVRSEVHLDYLQQVKQRGCEIIGTKGSVIWRSIGKAPEHCRIKVLSADGAEILLDTTALDGNFCYVQMARAFCDVIEGRRGDILASGQEGLSALAVVFESYEKGDKP